MDEFKDLDKEIDNLKKQLNFSADADNGMKFPEINDYWKRRLDEEKILFTKKMSTREEEKKALEFKINQQQSQIDQYHQALKQLEKKFEQESSSWEERLRIKEADLLIEKNRILSEEKVKEAEIEARRLLAQVAELNGRIARIKDEQDVEIQRLNENFSKEREAFNEKLKAAAMQAGVLEKRIKELEQNLKDKCAELESSKAENDQRLQRADAMVASLSAEKSVLLKEQQAQAAQLDALKKAAEEEKIEILAGHKNASQDFVQNMRRQFGPLVGLTHFVSRHRVTPATWHIFQDLIQKVDSETSNFTSLTNNRYFYNEPFKAVIALSDAEFAPWRGALQNTKAEAHRVAPGAVAGAVAKLRPQVVLLSSQTLSKVRAVRKRWPFLPVIVSGETDAKTTKRLLADGIPVIMPPYVIEEMVNVITRAAGNSIAQPDYWDKIKVKRSFAPVTLAAGFLLLAAAAGYVLRDKDFALPFDLGQASAVVTPYPQPTNLTYDGQYLWACDWLGQSIYKHRARGSLDIIRIFYFPGKHFSALAWAKGNLWSMDPWEKKIYRHNSDENLSVTASFDAPGSAPSGLAGDGDVLWSCDTATGMIYRHKLDDKLTVDMSWKSPGGSPSGLYYDGKNLWSADSKTNRIYRHNTDMRLSVAEAFLPQGYEQKGYTISGIAKSSKKFWVCSEKAGKIFQYSKDMLKKVPE